MREPERERETRACGGSLPSQRGVPASFARNEGEKLKESQSRLHIVFKLYLCKLWAALGRPIECLSPAVGARCRTPRTCLRTRSWRRSRTRALSPPTPPPTSPSTASSVSSRRKRSSVQSPPWDGTASARQRTSRRTLAGGAWWSSRQIIGSRHPCSSGSSSNTSD